jgi:putative hydrolase of the HAD superfamily
MEIRVKANDFFIFDLDDTLYSELTFLQSAYREIAKMLDAANTESLFAEMLQRYRHGGNVFKWLVEKHPNVTVEFLLNVYRHHVPMISFYDGVEDFLLTLRKLNIPIGLITDGRSVTQRNKLKALGAEQLFAEIIISEEFGCEKPDPRVFRFFNDKYPGKHFYYFADNPTKDFAVPASLGWTTVCLRDAGFNIHRQELPGTAIQYLIESFADIKILS